MATVTRPSKSLPDPGDALDAEPVRDHINNILAFLEGPNIDSANVDYTSSDGIAVLDQAQTISGAKTFSSDILTSGSGIVVGASSQVVISDGGGATNATPELQVLGTSFDDSTALLACFSTTATRAAAPTLALMKSGHGTLGSNTVVTDNEILGSIIAYGADGTDFESPAAAIEFAVDGTPGTGDMPGEIKMYTTADSGETLTLALTLSAAQAATFAGPVTVGSDGSGKDVVFYSGTSGDNLTWDASEEVLQITGTDGQTSLDVLDGDVRVVDKLYLYDRGGEYLSSDGSTLTITGAVSTSSTFETTGEATLASLACTAGATFGGGTGDSGATISTTGTGTFDGILKTEDTTDATSTTDGSLQTDGGLSVAKDAIIGNDLKLLSDSAVLALGAGDDATLTHDGTTGVTIAANPIIVDSGGNLTLDAHTGILIIKDAGSEVLRFTEGNSGDVTVKLETDGKDLIFTDNGDATNMKILDAAAGINVPGEVQTTGIGYTDGDNAITIADGGGCTFPQTIIATGGVSVNWTSSVETGTDENAQQIIIVDLDDPDDIWDFQAFMQLIQDTSWHDELGDPPIHGSMWINEAQDSVVWWNRETQAIYMQFDVAAGPANTNMIRRDPQSIVFLDGVIYIGHSTNGKGCLFLDLVRDRAINYFDNTDGSHLYAGDITSRNDGDDWIDLGNANGPEYLAVNRARACRDPEAVDEFGRPVPWVFASTSGGSSIFNGNDETWYQDARSDASYGVGLDDGGALAYVTHSTRQDVSLIRSIFAKASASFVPDEVSMINTGADAEDIAWTDGAGAYWPLGLLSRASLASVGMPVLLWGGDEGMYMQHTHPSDNARQGALIRLHEDYASPIMWGGCKGCYVGDSITDLSTTGNNLTNNNACTFSVGGPTGHYVNFDGVNQSLSYTTASDWDGDDNSYMAFWFYLDTLGAGDEYLAAKWDHDGAGGSWRHWFNSSGVLSSTVRVSAGYRTITGPTLATGRWYHFAYTLDPTDGSVWYLNGEVIGTDPTVGAINGNTYTAVFGAAWSLTDGLIENHMDGRIAGMTMTHAEGGGVAAGPPAQMVRAEYQRGLRCLNSGIDTNNTISDNNVASIAVDPNGKYFAVGYDDKNVDIFDALGVPILRDAYPGTTLRSVAIKSMPGGKDPHYIMAGDDQIEFVQPDTELTA